MSYTRICPCSVRLKHKVPGRGVDNEAGKIHNGGSWEFRCCGFWTMLLGKRKPKLS